MRTAIIIPARYESTRLPGKPLLRETGKYLVQHVYERARLARTVRDVVVATDDPRIEAAVRGFGGHVVLTRKDHSSGTDRVAEAAETLDADIIVNLQGDEPLIDPDSLDHVAELLARDVAADMATLATPLTEVADYRNPNVVKVVMDDRGRALYFSRSPIPFVRDGEPDFACSGLCFFRHVGLYAYRKPFLMQLARTPACSLEQLEKLEQLRALALGKAIHVGIVREHSIGVDTIEDYRRFVAMYLGMERRAA
jgi:3-deoxy-manno-octulosonate cytidylyltransferase (CMP-KDO synthetase)